MFSAFDTNERRQRHHLEFARSDRSSADDKSLKRSLNRRHYLPCIRQGGTHGRRKTMSEHATLPVSPRTTVKVALKENVTLDQLNKIIAGIGGRYGCRTCGLLGVDLQLAGDPGDFTEIAGFEGVK
jgi:hypothetical protein